MTSAMALPSSNPMALPKDKMLYIYLLCPHSKHQKNPFRSKQSKHFHKKTWFICETRSNKVKLPVLKPTVKLGQFPVLEPPVMSNLQMEVPNSKFITFKKCFSAVGWFFSFWNLEFWKFQIREFWNSS
jgi:hypothetical protein